MPDDLRQSAIAWISTQNGGRDVTCSLCGRDEWTVAQPVVVGELGQDGREVTGMGVKFIPMVCNHCGNTLLINAERAGL